MPPCEHRDDYFPQHRPAVNEPRAADKMKTVGPLRNPELHLDVAALRRPAGFAVPDRFVIRKLSPDQISFLGQNRSRRFLFKLALLCLCRWRFSKQKAMIGGDDDVIAVKA